MRSPLLVLLLGSLLVHHSALATQTDIRLATTTSTYHSGLLDYLLPIFEMETGYKVRIIAAGTGKALKMGENGDVDLVITHAPKAEQQFVLAGFGMLPRALMYNDFVIVGPRDDPASIADLDTTSAALSAIASNNALFVSRGDDSGTHKKERSLWQLSRISPTFSHYRSVGQGMGPTLNMASELQGYTLTDRGTWLAYRNKLALTLLHEGDEALFNPYQVILISNQRYPDINFTGAKALSDWLVSQQAQALINQFQLNGDQLFVASAQANSAENNDVDTNSLQAQ
ncbi:substrate-binding domain-containing protein [Vibrio agarilyticus]|uniref:substrate-binding domain-containing protein n=1 Tax=Vibrio agarilyticus TaxID=2726741 RepID=UPI003F6E0A44